MEDQNEHIMKEMEETRSSMTEKLEALEQTVTDKVQPVADAVERVSEAAAGIVENVKETVHDVTEKVEETVESVAKAFSLSRQADRHPWVVFSVAATAGCLLGTFTGARARRSQSSRSQGHGSHAKHRNGSNGSSHQAKSVREPQEEKQESWFGEQLHHLKGFAIGTLMSTLRDLAKAAVPGALGCEIAKEIESLTTRMGATPIQGTIIPSAPAQSPNPRTGDGEGATAEGATAGPYNRFRAEETGML